MSVPANNDSAQLGASRNAAVLSNYLPAIGTRVVIAADKSLPADADAVLVALIDGEDGLELVAPEAIGSVAEQLLASFEAVSASAKAESVTTIPAPAGLDVDSVTGVGVGSEDLQRISAVPAVPLPAACPRPRWSLTLSVPSIRRLRPRALHWALTLTRARRAPKKATRTPRKWSCWALMTTS